MDTATDTGNEGSSDSDSLGDWDTSERDTGPPDFGSVCDGYDVDCYTECFGCAMSYGCEPAYEACQASAGCVAFEYCRNDNCVAHNLTGWEWEACEQDCRESQWPADVALYDAFLTCIYCDQCAYSCQQEGAAEGYCFN